MTLEEAVQAAESGNIGAMNSLGDYFFEQNEIEKANQWFSKSATAGSPYGIHQSMLCDMMFAMASEDLGLWQDALDSWNAARAKALVLVQHEEVAENFKESARTQFLNTIVIGLGLANTCLKNYDMAIEWLKESEDDRAKILLGYCYFQGSDDTHSHAKAFHLMKILSEKPDVKLPASVKWVCLINLSMLYRFGDNLPDQSIKTDVAAAYRCVEMATTLPELSEKLAGIAREELKKYTKGLFGSYSYNG